MASSTSINCRPRLPPGCRAAKSSGVKSRRPLTTSARASPRASISEVLVLGASPRPQASRISPVATTTSAARPSVLSGRPVRATMPTRRAARCGRRRVISSVSPDCESASTTSSLRIAPRSPCMASAGCRKWLGVPVEASVAEIFRATSPALPIPVTTTLPVHSRIIRTPRQKSASSVSAARSTASPSARRIRRPCARMSSLLRSSMRRSFRQAPRAPERGGGMVGRLGKPRNADFAPVAGAKSVRIAARAALIGQACSRNRGSVMVTAAAFTPRRIASPCRRA